MPRITRAQAAYLATDPPLPGPQTSIISQNIGKLALDVLDLEARIAALEPAVAEEAGDPMPRRNRSNRKNRSSRKNGSSRRNHRNHNTRKH